MNAGQEHMREQPHVPNRIVGRVLEALRDARDRLDRADKTLVDVDVEQRDWAVEELVSACYVLEMLEAQIWYNVMHALKWLGVDYFGTPGHYINRRKGERWGGDVDVQG